MPPLIQALQDYDRLQRRRFHVPAHAGQNLFLPDHHDLFATPYRYDLTELDGLDVLSEPSGCLLEAQQEIADLFRVKQSYFLVNGATVGLMATMLALLKPGDAVLLPRNVHRSILSGLILTGAKPIWFLPERLPDWGLWGPVSTAQVTEQLNQHPQIKALFLTSPTYEGIGSDIKALSKLCRDQKIHLVVDEAHGSLWPLTEQLPQSACQFPCDAVIHSIHKSGSSLTQTAFAHLPYQSQIDSQLFQQALNTLQTTSPSYLLMASLEASACYLGSAMGQDRMNQLLAHVGSLRAHLQSRLKNFRLFQPEKKLTEWWDPCKLYFTHPHQSGEDWGAAIEANQQIAYESASVYGVLYLANLGLSAADFLAFQQAMLDKDQRTLGKNSPASAPVELANPSALIPEMAMSPRDAFFAAGKKIAREDAIGWIAKETIVHCPPGIPLLFPGERIQDTHIPFLPNSGVLVVRR